MSTHSRFLVNVVVPIDRLVQVSHICLTNTNKDDRIQASDITIEEESHQHLQ